MVLKNKEELGKLIRQTRALKGLTGSQLACKVGTTQSVISAIENGKRGIRLDTMLRVAQALDMELEISFLEGAE